MFLLVPAYLGCPGSKAIKRSLLVLLLTAIFTKDSLIFSVFLLILFMAKFLRLHFVAFNVQCRLK